MSHAFFHSSKANRNGHPLWEAIFLSWIFLLLSACLYKSSTAPMAVEDIPKGYELHQITLPSSISEENDVNAQVYSIPQFTFNLCLPSGWTIREATQLRQEGIEVYPAVTGIISIQCILDETGYAIGSLGYNLAPYYDEPTSEPMALFAGITLARRHFDCKDAFTAIIEENGFLVALTNVIQEGSNAKEEEEICGRGILIRDEQIGVYIAIEVRTEVLTEAQLDTIARHLTLIQQ